MPDALPPHLRFTPPAPTLLGRKVLSLDPETGEVRLRFFAPPQFANRHGSVQGGLLSAMLDSATSVAVLAQLDEDQSALTMTLETRFLKPAPLGELIGVSRMLALDERDASSEGRIESPDGAIVATARATLRIRRKA